jgi:hypothetical protein
MSPDVRLSPDWTRVAIRSGLQNDWEVSGYRHRLTDDEVCNWLPMVQSNQVVCPWCGKYVTPYDSGRLRRHHSPATSSRCEGSGRLRSECGGAP